MKNKFFSFFLLLLAPMWLYGQRGLFVPNGSNGTTAATSEHRIALVIGNNSYSGGGWQPLRNPINDAKVMTAVLRELGFDVIQLQNASKSEMWNAVLQLAQKVRGSQTVALVFYAGHGVESEGENFWVSVDDRSTCRDEISINNLSIKAVNTKLRNVGVAFNIVVSDACRNNSLPFTCVGAGRDGGRSGFIEYKAKGSLIAFSTSPGATAADGTGQSNSPYTAALAKAMRTEGLTIEDVFKQVNRELEMQGQEPWMNNAFNGSFYFKLPSAPAPSVAVVPNAVRKDPQVPTPSVVVTPPPAPVGKSEFTEYGTGVSFTMKYISGNSFQMGGNDADAYDWEKPVHTVRLGEFYMSKYEVTFSEYDKFCEATKREKPSDEGWGRGSRPVINVSWDDAVAYCSWLSRTTGKTYRLPTEAEWEYAARGGSSDKYSGSSDIAKVGWYRDNSGNKTHPVGEKSANGYGLHDMSGNVWEWCSDWFGSYVGNSTSNPTLNPTGATSGSYRVLRGGSWLFNARYTRCADRSSSNPVYRSNFLGFRVVCLP